MSATHPRNGEPQRAQRRHTIGSRSQRKDDAERPTDLCVLSWTSVISVVVLAGA